MVKVTCSIVVFASKWLRGTLLGHPELNTKYEGYACVPIKEYRLLDAVIYHVDIAI